MDLTTLLLIVGAFYLGWIARGATLLAGMSDNPEKFIKLLEDIKKINTAEAAGITEEDAVALAKSTKVRVDMVQDVVYLYRLEDNEFISQGSSIEDAMAQGQKRFPGKTFWLEKQNISSQTA